MDDDAKKENRENLKKAVEAYGISEDDVFSWKDRKGEVSIVTRGGARAKWKEGDKVQKLSVTEATGRNPEKERQLRARKQKKQG